MERKVMRFFRARTKKEKRIDLFLGNVIPGYSNLHGKKSGGEMFYYPLDELLFSSLHLEFFHGYIDIGSSFASTFFLNILRSLDKAKRLILLSSEKSFEYLFYNTLKD